MSFTVGGGLTGLGIYVGGDFPLHYYGYFHRFFSVFTALTMASLAWFVIGIYLTGVEEVRSSRRRLLLWVSWVMAAAAVCVVFAVPGGSFSFVETQYFFQMLMFGIVALPAGMAFGKLEKGGWVAFLPPATEIATLSVIIAVWGPGLHWA